MSKTVELARHLETLHINNMYKTDFYWTWDKTDEEIDAVFTVADALRDLRERNKNTKIFNSGLGISIFRDNSTRTRFSFASACNLLGLEEQVLDEKKSQIAHGETVRETANMVSFMADVIGIRDDMFIGEGHKYQKTFMDALEEGYRDGILEQRPTLVNLQCDVDHPTQCMADMLHIIHYFGGVENLKGKKVAGPRGTVLHQLLIAALVKEGMSADDVEFLSMDIPAAMTAVTSGRVDAALLAASGIIKAEEAGCRVVTTAKGLVDVNLVMTASKQFAEKHPEALETVVRVEREADEWIKANWQEAVAIGAKEHGISLADAEKLAGWSHYYGVLTDADVKGLEADQKFLIENGLMTTPVDVKSIVLPIALGK